MSKRQQSNLDTYIEILKALRCTKTIKQLSQLVDSISSTTIYHIIYYLEEKRLVQENGTILIRSEKSITQAKRARLYVTTERGRKLISVFDN